MFDFSDRVVIVTGASGNLGSAAASSFQQAGARVVLVGQDQDSLRQAFPAAERQPDRYMFGVADLTDGGSVQAMVRDVLARFGQIDILANTVGGYRAGTPIHETPLDTWDFMLNLNARTAFIISQAVVPPMLERGYGKIIHVAARAALSGGAKMAAYSISKSAVVRLTESLAAELRLKGINANCVLPGTIDTPQNREAMPDTDFNRWVTPEAIADVILFLASDAARAINGAAIPVYGQS